MPILVQLLFLLFASGCCSMGALMIFAPRAYPKFYEGFLGESIMRWQHTERDRVLAVRVQGLIALAVDAFFALFVWAVR